ncbi:MAG: sodium-dependent transporter [Burkholderiaceae bacterium]
MSATRDREQWGSHYGFVLATIGSAVGLGNIWRFSYVAGENGGGAFLIVYVVCVIVVGTPIVLAELALGRRAQGDAVSAFDTIAPGSAWGGVGWLAVISGFVILSYYSVIAGWALKYLTGALLGSLWTQAGTGFGAYFTGFISNPGEPIGWQLAMLGSAMFIVAGGVQKGIESVNRLLMPLLGGVIIGLAAYGATLPDAGAGWRFLLEPDFSALHDPTVYVAALGQAFFSLGIGMAVFITYGSYLPRSIPLKTSAIAIILGDSLFAIVAGLAIFPAVFSFGMDPAAGPELAFITLPQVFLAMPGGTVIGSIFFALLVCAALTSMISLLEVPVAFLVHRFAFRRWSAVSLVGGICFALGIPSALSFGLLSGIQIGSHGILDAIDQTVSNYLLPTGGILVALFVGWRWTRSEALAEAELDDSRLGVTWLWLLRAVSPALIALILLSNTGVL